VQLNGILQPRASAVALVFAAAMTVAAAPAQADTIITATYTGSIQQIFDPTGIFGTVVSQPAPSNFGFVDTFSFDLESGARLTGPVGGNPADNLLGGSDFGGSAPLLSSRLTINGVTLDFLGGLVSQQFTEQTHDISSAALNVDANGVTTINEMAIGIDAPGLLTTPFSGTNASNPFTGALLICKFVGSGCNSATLSGILVPQSVTVTVSNSVPEPASWALMLLGFGGVGAALRRRGAIAA
jgi:hypothetical protein